tara:strand:+ start:3354 stop:4145 length:792 start_codon:yes stop_codon:yes gene_type:complete
MKKQDLQRFIQEEIEAVINEHGELDEGFLDRLKARISGTAGSAGAAIKQGAAKLGDKVSKDIDVQYTGADPQVKKKALMLKSRATTALKNFQALTQDFTNDALTLGLGEEPIQAINAASSEYQDALSAAIERATDMAAGKAQPDSGAAPQAQPEREPTAAQVSGPGPAEPTAEMDPTAPMQGTNDLEQSLANQDDEDPTVKTSTAPRPAARRPFRKRQRPRIGGRVRQNPRLGSASRAAAQENKTNQEFINMLTEKVLEKILK